jgi:hypothetical protein
VINAGRASEGTAMNGAWVLCAVVPLGLSTITCAAPMDDNPSGYEQVTASATCTAADPDAVLYEIKKIADIAKDLPAYYGAFAKVFTGILSFADAVGWIHQTSEAEKVAADLDCVGLKLSWQMALIDRDHDLGDMGGTLDTISTFNASNMPYTFSSPGYQDSVNAVEHAEQRSAFLRYASVGSNDSATDGDWKWIIPGRPVPDPQDLGLAFDWRVGVPVLMKLIALRTVVIDTVDPNFATDHWFDQEFTDQYNALNGAYTKMVDGVRCGMRELKVNNSQGYYIGPPQPPTYSCYFACADIYTGTSATYSFQNSSGPCSQYTATPSGQAKLPSLRAQVVQKMPFFEMKAVIDSLQTFLHPGPDLGQTYHQMDLETATNSCLTVDGPNAPGTPVRLRRCNGGIAQTWQLDRVNGQIVNQSLGSCLTAVSGSPFSVVSAPCTQPVVDATTPLPAMSDATQQWTYDPLTRVIQSGLDPTFTLSAANLSAEVDVVVSPIASLAHQWHADQPYNPVTPAPPTYCGALLPGEGIANNGSQPALNSCNNAFELATQPWGAVDLIQVFDGWTWGQWSTGGYDGMAGETAIMQGDGNFVVYNPRGGVVWSTYTQGQPGSYLALQSDGNLVVYNASGWPIWSVNSPFTPPWGCGTLTIGQGLSQGTTMSSCDGRYTLSMGADGNLVLFKSGAGPVWASGTSAPGNLSMAILQTDGNFVINNRATNPPTALWSTHSQAIDVQPGGAYVKIEDDGYLVVYSANNTALWKSGTPPATSSVPYTTITLGTSLDWAAGQFGARCTNGGRLIGLAARAGGEDEALCILDPAYEFSPWQVVVPRAPPVVPTHIQYNGWDQRLASRSVAGASDWDVGFAKQECGLGQFVSGLVKSRSTGNPFYGMECETVKPLWSLSNTCNVRALGTQDDRTSSIEGDWDVGAIKAECGADQYVAGVSVDGSTGHVHRLLCCNDAQ